jgi:hypothetical protein
MSIVIVEEKPNQNSNETYIKTQGMSQSIIQQPGVNSVNQVNWDADYNGKVANLNLDVNTNGKKDNYTMQLTNGDLENLLNIPSMNKSLEERLEDDFLINDDYTPILQYKPQPYLFRPNNYSKPKFKNYQNLENQISDELRQVTSQDEETIKSEINHLIQLKKKLQHPYKGKHNHTHYKSRHSKKSKKHNNYKTPSPQTMRIHLKDDHNVSLNHKKRRSRKKRKTSSPKKESSFLSRISNLI